MCMFCLTVHSRATLLCGSHSPRSKVQSCAIRLPIAPHGVCPQWHTHTPCREAFFCVSQVLRHDNPKLGSKDDNHSTFWDVLRRNVSVAKFAWRNLLANCAWRNLPAKSAGEICQLNLPAKFAAEFVGEIFGENKLGKTSLIFGEKPPPKISLANSTVLKTCHRHIPRTLPAFFEVGRREQLRSRDSVCSCSADASAKQAARRGVPKLGFSVIFAVT